MKITSGLMGQNVTLSICKIVRDLNICTFVQGVKHRLFCGHFSFSFFFNFFKTIVFVTICDTVQDVEIIFALI